MPLPLPHVLLCRFCDGAPLPCCSDNVCLSVVYNLEGSSVSADPSSAVRKPAAAHTAAATASAGVDETAFDEDAAAEEGEELGAMTTSNAQPVHTEYNQVPENDSEDAGDGDGDDTAEGQVIGNENEQ